MGDSGCDAQPITHDKGKGVIVPNNIDTPGDDELSLGNSPSLNLLSAKNTWESTRTRSRKRPSPHPVFSDAISGASRRVRREASRRHYRLSQASGNSLVLLSGTLQPVPLEHHAFGTTVMFYIPPATPRRWPLTS